MASISGSNRVVPTVTNTVFELVCELFIGICICLMLVSWCTSLIVFGSVVLHTL